MRRIVYLLPVLLVVGLVLWGVLGGQKWALIALAVFLGAIVFGMTTSTPSRQAAAGGDPGRGAADEYAREQGWTDL